MGLQVNKNDSEQYQLIETIGNESMHPDKQWISEDEAKAILIQSAFNDFVERTIEIDMTFPKRYNDMLNPEIKPNFYKWLSSAKGEEIQEKFGEIFERLNLSITNEKI